MPERRRRRLHISYELLSCATEDHALVGTDAATIRPEDYLIARELDGGRWYRCLRCDSWVAMAPPAEPRRAHPPDRDEIELPLRGRPLRDRYVLRLIALDRAVHVVVLSALAVAIFVFVTHRSQLQQAVYRILGDVQGGVGGPAHTVHRGFLGELDKVVSLQPHTLEIAGGLVAGYAVLEAVEMVGLWYGRRWAEYLTFVATTVLLPLEVYELTTRITALKVIALVVNLAIVVYLLLAKRLFGLRGGERALQAIRERELGWSAIERATPPTFDARRVAATGPAREAGRTPRPGAVP
ncbi:MAG TPA: DUF2127 domain-containing protein [Acidimicrobiales bacterium]|jgi:uncharacterized membrane protein (DUF2068 family)|nr:DUF2127 domain-containing protein [Acidimicrobiales bacterium]